MLFLVGGEWEKKEGDFVYDNIDVLLNFKNLESFKSNKKLLCIEINILGN